MSADENNPMPITADELSDDERRWLVDLEGVDLEDPRVIIVRAAGDSIGFDVATSRGPASIRLDNAATTGRLREVRFPDGSADLVPELNMEAFGLPWAITVAPGRLAGTRYENVGRAVRAALRGFPWPEGWPGLEERSFPTDIPDRAASVPGVFVEDPIGFEPYQGRAAAWSWTPPQEPPAAVLRVRPDERYAGDNSIHFDREADGWRLVMNGRPGTEPLEWLQVVAACGSVYGGRTLRDVTPERLSEERR